MSAIYSDLKDRTVFITGGAAGIGAAMVEAFAAQGARTAFIDIDAQAGMALADTTGARFDVCDVCELGMTSATSFTNIINEQTSNQKDLIYRWNVPADPVMYSAILDAKGF